MSIDELGHFTHCTELCTSVLSNTWEIMTKLPTGRHGHSCGVIPSQSGSGREVVVVGGTDTERAVEIYSVDSNSWRKGEKDTRALALQTCGNIKPQPLSVS